MNSTRPQRPVRKRRGIFYYSPENEELGPGFYMHMFSEDLAVSIMPIGGRSSRTNFRVTISPDEERAKDIIMTGLKEHGHGHSLADTLYDFFQLVSAYLTTSERAVFEVVYLEEQQTRTLIGFELAAIAETQIVEKRGQFFQCVPPQLAVERNVPEMIPLEKENLIIFRPPMEFEKPLRRLRRGLSELDKLQFPALMLEATKRNIPYDFKAHERSMKLALVEAVKPIGWNARGSFNDSVLSYYWILMSLTFERFKIRLRETMLDTLNAGFERIGEKLGFEARLKIEGLPTLADVDHAIEQLNSGAMPFTEVMKPFELS
jgi:hypothetical protein